MASSVRREGRLPRVYYRRTPPQDAPLLQPNGPVRSAPNAAPPLKLDRFIGPVLESLEPGETWRPTGALETSDATPDFQARLLHSGDGRTPAPRFAGPQAKLTFYEKNLPEVPRILAHNPGPPALLSGGLAFLGGSQNRMLLEPQILPSGVSELPVYCIQAGRWELRPGRIEFTETRRAPDLIYHKVLHSLNQPAADNEASSEDLQLQIWGMILEGLALSDNHNASMDLMKFVRDHGERFPVKVSRDANDTRAGRGESRSALFAGGARAFFANDPKAGLDNFGCYPDAHFTEERLAAFQDELRFRNQLRSNASGAREYFRIFDADRSLAIRCTPDGKPLKDLSGRPLLFSYAEADLEYSFTPPLQKPPPAEELDFSMETPALRDWTDWRQALRECEVQVLPGNPREGVYGLRFRHPELSLCGSGLLADKRLALLEATGFRTGASLN